MASELTVTILRFAFLGLLWFFVFFVVAAARRDLGLGKNFRSVPVESCSSSCTSFPLGDHQGSAGGSYDAVG